MQGTFYQKALPARLTEDHAYRITGTPASPACRKKLAIPKWGPGGGGGGGAMLLPAQYEAVSFFWSNTLFGTNRMYSARPPAQSATLPHQGQPQPKPGAVPVRNDKGTETHKIGASQAHTRGCQSPHQGPPQPMHQGPPQPTPGAAT